MIVPKQHERGIKALARFSDEDVGAILNSLSQKTNLPALISVVSAKVSSIPRNDIEQALRAVFSLSTLRADLGDALPKFIDDVMGAITDSTLGLSEDEQKKLRENLDRMLGYDLLNIAAKTLYLKTDYEHTYCRARILTDIRPVFGEDRTVPPLAGIITHILKIHYHEGDAFKEIHIAMNETDLASLKSLLERAESKQKSLKSWLDATKLLVITK